ncbi:Nucleus export protein Brr6 [Metarhizium album ARSEF 1941]|uniref:Nucleus export protein Brr6 n=1 Tax=Metarhizium album (strain ARSEF 1941) TaxID=1081103 RepID=A0A0B2WEU4_METAS|nr:Nucleus export protein Brr6 [Metarhizium album ARSEF 1941]KHN94391.1 Nucleus export protein Brr6 [Metarhizium album ARSEF 1941]
MDARSFEGPMDWEYQDNGPLDPTSPFAQAAKNIQRSAVGSPFKTARPPNPFAHPQSPSKSQFSLPQTSQFTPQLSSRNTAPPFRNPAFTTPRKPVDEVVFSEASGAEDSPAAAEVSDYPNDTPEVDRKADVSMGATITPLKIDKSSRYGKSSSKKHLSGKGEIRAHRDLNVSMRKRKRHNLDKDVGSIARHSGYEDDSCDSGSDSDAVGGARRSRSRSKGKGDSRGGRGYFESLFYALNKYPNTPDHMQRWMQLGANVFLVSVLTYVSWSVVSTIRTDISNANMAAHQKIVSSMDACRHDYTINDCANNNKPALSKPCSEWYECMMQDPDAIMRVKVTAKQVAEIINEFTETMHLKAWGVIVAIIAICSTVNFRAFSRSHGHRGMHPTPSQPAGDVQDNVRSPGITPGYMLVPVQTPRMQRQALLDEGTDTDNSPINMKPYHTPAGRRSPSKVNSQSSPIKYGLGPSKGY